MLRLKHKVLLSICGTLALTGVAFAQAANDQASPDPAAQNQQADIQPGGVSDQPADASPKNLGQGTKAQAEHSAEATAHKSLNDPNNQLGTSLQGRTRPIAGAEGGSQNQTAMTASPPDANQQAAAE